MINMLTCTICGSNQNVYKKRMICKKCYQKEYTKKYYQQNKESIKARSLVNHQNNRDERLKRMKKYRESEQFNSKREQILKRDNYTCCKCQTCFKDDPSKLTVHHHDRQGRGSLIKNNEDDNLETLCRACHASEHAEDLKRAKREKLEKQWSHKYTACIECGTTERKHQGRGLCRNCHARYLRNKG